MCAVFLCPGCITSHGGWLALRSYGKPSMPPLLRCSAYPLIVMSLFRSRSFETKSLRYGCQWLDTFIPGLIPRCLAHFARDV
ncbi:hypothetical protein BDZ85DRAFT_256522 [Elsinoe ampelina]|uniref:Uncharacterized protein n=1 Tax=Elsinoe ampelina TaxID=302913 RepID=A0A6A6GLK7_9PEZI|nr:hypothetical protein BDZ85DRAFT_256522 [Elsinoe ampelina]